MSIASLFYSVLETEHRASYTLGKHPFIDSCMQKKVLDEEKSCIHFLENVYFLSSFLPLLLSLALI